MNTTGIKHLFEKTNSLIQYQNNLEKIKGEKFNIFSILKMSSKEDKLHSRFIKELLNPKGTHLKGRLFLDIFLEIIESKYQKSETTELNYANVYREYVIGNNNLANKTGGRIDILISDKDFTHTICLENKIYAGDQEAQIERYCNYNKKNNIVFYLTLFGNEPDKKSKGNLKVNEDFQLLSYKDDIIQWLELCLKEVFDSPILRESIKQYLILIKKLTNTMNNNEIEEEFNNLILKNYKEAKYINSHFDGSLNKLRKSFKKKFRKELSTQMNDNDILKGLKVGGDDEVNQKFSTVWINVDKGHEPEFKFGIENFNGNLNTHWKGDLFVGVFKRIDRKKQYLELKNEDSAPHSSWLKATRLEFENKNVNFDEVSFLKMIKNLNSEAFNKLLKETVKQAINYMESFVLNDLKGKEHLILPDKSNLTPHKSAQ